MITSNQWQPLQALLAKWFHTQPSEIDNMLVDEFIGWVDEANKQIEKQAEASEG